MQQQIQRLGVPTKVCNGEFVLRSRKVEPCNGLCIPLVSQNNPTASEWYCPGCRISYGMSTGEYNAIGPSTPAKR